ncbi:hypothetical protein [uncultured Shimia sp.]|uniref:hypothetical protein n=1 Tax=uncultured Shimia sp. TaxID=573152 RepID=UPI002607D81A|nr:hypothetical protein [uncultured Shimia sp.]
MDKSNTEVDERAIRDAVSRILQSPEFAHAKRLRGFVAYVVGEALEGRKDLISARTIAQDVYGRGNMENDSDLSVVRVDAGRLRRRLAEYYAGSAQGDPVRIDIPMGSYSPEFSVGKPTIPADTTDEKTERRVTGRLAIAALLGVLALSMFLLIDRVREANVPAVNPSSEVKSATRRALLEKSPSALQAANQAEQARNLLFPAPDPVRLQLVLSLFQHVIDLDDTYFGGYAGAAQVTGLLAALIPEGPDRDAALEQAKAFSSRAVSLRPDSSWVQSAAAWVALCDRDYATAKRLSENALELNPNDLHAREIDALISLFTGDFQRAVKMSDPASYLAAGIERGTSRNVFAISKFYLGDPAETVHQFEILIGQGEPISEISIFYLVAALWKIGEHEAARDYVSYYHKAWSKGRVDQLLARVFISTEYLEGPTALFREAGGF